MLNRLSSIAALLGVTNAAITGTNLGGWQVLEPWITPSLFYQFTDRNNTENQVAMDTYTFCEALGAEEGNRQLRAHWDKWVTEDTFEALAKREVTMVRLPIGDWTLEPYGPYINCTEGAVDYIDKAFEWGAKHKIDILLDIHAVRGS